MPISEKEFIALSDTAFNRKVAGWMGMCWHSIVWGDISYYCEKCKSRLKELGGDPNKVNPDFRHSPEGLKIMLEWLKKNIPTSLIMNVTLKQEKYLNRK